MNKDNVTPLVSKVIEPTDVFEMCMTDMQGNDCVPDSGRLLVDFHKTMKKNRFFIRNPQGKRLEVTITVREKS